MAPFCFGVDFNSASDHPPITADINLVHDLDVFNNLVFICHDIVDFVKCFVAWTSPGPSPLVLLVGARVHDLKATGNGETFFISASNLCV